MATEVKGSTASDRPAQDQGLSQRLVAASRKIHSLSDALVNLKLVALFGSPQLYARAIARFYLVFRQLEDSFDAAAAADPRLRGLHTLALPLYRAAAFEADLEYFLGPEWRADVAASCSVPEVQAYCSHLRALASRAPLLVAAHSFTQHLAVASGGQIIARLVRRGLRLPGHEGTQVYAYPGASAKAAKTAFKEGLDALGETLSEAEVQQLVEEHCKAFAYNNSIIKAYRVGPLAPYYALRLALGPRLTAAAVVAAAVVAACAIRAWMR